MNPRLTSVLTAHYNAVWRCMRPLLVMRVALTSITNPLQASRTVCTQFIQSRNKGEMHAVTLPIGPFSILFSAATIAGRAWLWIQSLNMKLSMWLNKRGNWNSAMQTHDDIKNIRQGTAVEFRMSTCMNVDSILFYIQSIIIDRSKPRTWIKWTVSVGNQTEM